MALNETTLFETPLYKLKIKPSTRKADSILGKAGPTLSPQLSFKTRNFPSIPPVVSGRHPQIHRAEVFLM